jgi:hypothetical protein
VLHKKTKEASSYVGDNSPFSGAMFSICIKVNILTKMAMVIMMMTIMTMMSTTVVWAPRNTIDLNKQLKQAGSNRV